MEGTLYHGSQIILEKPEYGKGARNNDYGRGFQRGAAGNLNAVGGMELV